MSQHKHTSVRVEGASPDFGIGIRYSYDIVTAILAPLPEVRCVLTALKAKVILASF
jgi:hypothetical protein